MNCAVAYGSVLNRYYQHEQRAPEGMLRALLTLTADSHAQTHVSVERSTVGRWGRRALPALLRGYSGGVVGQLGDVQSYEGTVVRDLPESAAGAALPLSVPVHRWRTGVLGWPPNGPVVQRHGCGRIARACE